ncbi:MAG: type II toxin-antitoxin system RelE/ParE family toxin [Candidatus Bipolaricaulia bacterium]
MSSGTTYEVRLSRSARKYYEKCDPDVAKQLETCFEDLEKDPFPPHPRIKKLRGELSGNYRFRVGQLRVVYTIFKDERVVYIRAIGPRGDVY